MPLSCTGMLPDSALYGRLSSLSAKSVPRLLGRVPEREALEARLPRATGTPVQETWFKNCFCSMVESIIQHFLQTVPRVYQYSPEEPWYTVPSVIIQYCPMAGIGNSATGVPVHRVHRVTGQQ